MAQQDNPYEDQDIWNDLSEAGSEMKNVFNEMTNNYFTENSFLSAVGNLMKSLDTWQQSLQHPALLPLFTISTRLSFCRTSIGRRLNLTENFFCTSLYSLPNLMDFFTDPAIYRNSTFEWYFWFKLQSNLYIICLGLPPTVRTFLVEKLLPYNNHVLVLLFGTVASLFYHYRHHCIDSLYYTMG